MKKTLKSNSGSPLYYICRKYIIGECEHTISEKTDSEYVAEASNLDHLLISSQNNRDKYIDFIMNSPGYLYKLHAIFDDLE
jgi:hypothetical protein